LTLFNEQRVIFLCANHLLLQNIIDTFITLIFPFKWQHLLVPLLHYTCRDLLLIKQPYIAGVTTHSLEQMLKIKFETEVLSLNELNQYNCGLYDQPNYPHCTLAPPPTISTKDPSQRAINDPILPNLGPESTTFDPLSKEEWYVYSMINTTYSPFASSASSTAAYSTSSPHSNPPQPDLTSRAHLDKKVEQVERVNEDGTKHKPTCIVFSAWNLYLCLFAKI